MGARIFTADGFDMLTTGFADCTDALAEKLKAEG